MKKGFKWIAATAMIAFFLGFAILIAFVVILIVGGHRVGIPVSLSDSANSGAFIGGVVGTFWILGSFLLFFLSLRLQQDSLQRQKEENQRQLSSFEIGRFEEHVFRMLEFHETIVASITLDRQERLSGRSALRALSLDLKKVFLVIMEASDRSDPDRVTDRCGFRPLEMWICLYSDESEKQTDQQAVLKTVGRRVWLQFFETFHDQLGSYFRHLYHTFLFVEDRCPAASVAGSPSQGSQLSAVAGLTKKQYFDLVISHLSSAELYLLFFNGLVFPKTYELLDKNHLLENLAIQDLPNISFEELYPSTKFKERPDFPWQA